MSNAELSLQFKGARQRVDAQYEWGLWVAYHIAALMRVPKSKPLPKLDVMLSEVRKKKTKPTKAQQRAMFLDVADRFGLTVKRVPKKKP